MCLQKTVLVGQLGFLVCCYLSGDLQDAPRQPAVCALLEGVLRRIGRVTSKVVVQKAEFSEAVKRVISGSKSLSKKYDKAAVMACLASGPQVLDDALLYLSKTGKVSTAYPIQNLKLTISL